MKFCGENQQVTDSPEWFDPMGNYRKDTQNKSYYTGGPEQRDAIFGQLDNLNKNQFQPNAQKLTDQFNAANADPGWGQAQSNARGAARGDYLGGTPQFNQIMGDFAQNFNSSQTDYTKAAQRGDYLNPTGRANWANPTSDVTARGDFLGRQIPQAGAIPQEGARGWAGQGGNVAGQAIGAMGGQSPGQTTQRTINGSYLNAGPQLNYNVDPAVAAMRKGANAEASDLNANVRSSFNKAGLGFSTTNQQAQQAQQAASSARSNEGEAQMRLGAQMEEQRGKQAAYMAERGLQQQASLSEDAAQRQLGQNRASAVMAGGMQDLENRYGADNRERNFSLANYGNERNMQAQNYMQERGYQQQAAQQDSASRAQNYMQERNLQNQVGTQEQNASRDAIKYLADSRKQNYGTERGVQLGAADQLANAYAPQLNYLSQLPNASLGPLSQISQIVAGLSGGGPIATPNSTIVQKPGVYDYFLSTLGAAGGAAGGAAAGGF